jgi:hypothetical protein
MLFPGHGNLHFFLVVKLKGSKSYLHVRFQFVLQHICRIRFNNPVFRGKDKRVQYKIAMQNRTCKCIFRLPLPKTVRQVWTRECSTISLLTFCNFKHQNRFKNGSKLKGTGKEEKTQNEGKDCWKTFKLAPRLLFYRQNDCLRLIQPCIF